MKNQNNHPALELFFEQYKVLLHVIGAGLGAVWGFVDNFIWNPAEAYFLVMSLLLVDFIFGYLAAIKTRQYTTERRFDCLKYMVAYTIILFYSFQFAKTGAALSVLPHVVFVPMVIVPFFSLVKNLSKLNWLPAKLDTWLNSRLETFKNPLNTYENVKSTQPSEPVNDAQLIAH